MLFYPAALPLSCQALDYTAGIIHRHRKQIGSGWRELNLGDRPCSYWPTCARARHSPRWAQACHPILRFPANRPGISVGRYSLEITSLDGGPRFEQGKNKRSSLSPRCPLACL
jgi:hypothetical protein